MNKAKKAALPPKKVRKNHIGAMMKVLCTSRDTEMIKELRRLNVNPAQFAILMTLSDQEGLTQSEIGQKLTMPGYATTRTIDTLEERQFVERRKDARSRRSYRIHLTAKSRNIVPGLFAIVSGVNERLLSALSTKEQKVLATILNKLV